MLTFALNLVEAFSHSDFYLFISHFHSSLILLFPFFQSFLEFSSLFVTSALISIYLYIINNVYSNLDGSGERNRLPSFFTLAP